MFIKQAQPPPWKSSRLLKFYKPQSWMIKKKTWQKYPRLGEIPNFYFEWSTCLGLPQGIPKSYAILVSFSWEKSRSKKGASYHPKLKIVVFSKPSEKSGDKPGRILSHWNTGCFNRETLQWPMTSSVCNWVAYIIPYINLSNQGICHFSVGFLVFPTPSTDIIWSNHVAEEGFLPAPSSRGAVLKP